MKYWVSGMLRRLRLRRETSLITEAMRSTPRPMPPSGLKERLIAEAMAASDHAPAQPVRPRAWLAWAAPAAAVTALAAWLVWSNTRPASQPIVERPEVPSVVTPHVLPKPAETAQSEQPEVQSSPRRSPVRRNTVAAAPVQARHKAPLRRFRHQRFVAEKPGIQASERIETEAPPMQVTVSRAKEGSTGYARASVWTTDPSGNAVKTQWAVIRDSETNRSREELSVTDAAGRSQSVTVVVDDKT